MNRFFIRRFSVDIARIPADSYLAGLPAVRGGGLTFTAPVTFFVGENGTGKSTLIEALAVAYGLNPEGGSRNFVFSTRDSHSPLWRAVHLEKGAVSPRDAYFLRAESFYNVATNIDELDDAPGDSSPLIRSAYGGVSLHEQSHARASWHWCGNAFPAADCISSMSRRPPCRRSGRWRCSLASMSWRRRGHS